MNAKPSLLLLLLALLLAETAGVSLARAESPLPDPVAPAVIGRPLDQIRPARKSTPAAGKPTAARKTASRQASAPRPVGQQAAAAQPQRTSQQILGGPGLPPGAPPLPHQAKSALDDRADPNMQLGEVGKGSHFARKPLGPGAYFDDGNRQAVHKYYESHAMAGKGINWQIGQPLPSGAVIGGVPAPLLSSLPKVPPGHRYVQAGGDILLIASGSKMVVDAISRTAR